MPDSCAAVRRWRWYGSEVHAWWGWAARIGLGCGLWITGCGDDEIAPYGVSEGGDTGPVRVEPSTDGHIERGCQQHLDCDDDNPCTLDGCVEGVCVSHPDERFECRPTIEVSFPPRAATLQSDAPEVEVRGTVHAPTSHVVGLSLNGVPVDVAPDGGFLHSVTTQTGSNTLVFEVLDADGKTRRRVQSFLWSPAYVQPTDYPDGLLPQGISVYLDQESIDDGTREQPADDIGTLFASAIEGIDLGSLAGGEPLTHIAGYDLELTTLTRETTSSRLAAIDDGLSVEVSLDGLSGVLTFRCLHSACDLTGGDGRGTFRLETVRVVATTRLDVDDAHRLRLDVTSIDASIEGLSLASGIEWVDALLGLAAPVLEDLFFPVLEATVQSEVERMISTEIADRLGTLEIDAPLHLPPVPGATGEPPVAHIRSDLTTVDIHDGQFPPRPSPSHGAAFFFEAGVFGPDDRPLPENLGVPLRYGCGLGSPSYDLPRAGALEIGFPDDLVNEALYAAWRGGLLQIPIRIRDITGEAVLDVEGLAAPTLDDCRADGLPRLSIGDVRLDAEVTLLGSRVAFRSYTTMSAELVFEIVPEGVALRFGEVTTMETEIETHDEMSSALEETLVRTVEDQLRDALFGAASGDASLTLPIPTLGTSGLTPRVDAIERRAGMTVLSAHF